MLKRIGISVATLCAALALAKPPSASAADRDDYNNQPSYRYSEGRNSYEGYQPRGRFQNDYRNGRRGSKWQNRYGYNQRGSEWREHDRRDQRQSWDYRDRDRDNSYER